MRFDDPFDDRLRQAFRREEPGAGFAERTMAAVRRRPRLSSASRGSWAAWLTLAAAMVMILAGGTSAVLMRQRAWQARQDLELALRIVTDTVNQVQLKLSEDEREGAPDAR